MSDNNCQWKLTKKFNKQLKTQISHHTINSQTHSIKTIQKCEAKKKSKIEVRLRFNRSSLRNEIESNTEIAARYPNAKKKEKKTLLKFDI